MFREDHFSWLSYHSSNKSSYINNRWSCDIIICWVCHIKNNWACHINNCRACHINNCRACRINKWGVCHINSYCACHINSKWAFFFFCGPRRVNICWAFFTCFINALVSFLINMLLETSMFLFLIYYSSNCITSGRFKMKKISVVKCTWRCESAPLNKMSITFFLALRLINSDYELKKKKTQTPWRNMNPVFLSPFSMTESEKKNLFCFSNLSRVLSKRSIN